MEKYLPDGMRLEETSARRSLMTSMQREQVEKLLADDNEDKVEVKKEEVKEGRRRSARHSTTTRYKQESESESAESDWEEKVVKRVRTEDKQEKGLKALEELETFDFGVKPKTEEAKSSKGGLSISFARQKPAAKRKTEEILEIVDSSEEEESDVEEVEIEEKKTRSGRIIRKPTIEVLMPSKKNTAPASKRGRFRNAPRSKTQKAESDSDEDNSDDNEDDDVVVEMVGKRSMKGKVEMEGKRGLRRGLRTSVRRVQTVDLD